MTETKTKRVFADIDEEDHIAFLILCKRNRLTMQDAVKNFVRKSIIDNETPEPTALPLGVSRALEHFILHPKDEKDTLLRDYLVSKLKSEYST